MCRRWERNLGRKAATMTKKKEKKKKRICFLNPSQAATLFGNAGGAELASWLLSDSDTWASLFIFISSYF